MRLNPPITVLAILALPLIWLSITWRNHDCYYFPDGRERFSNFLEAITSRIRAGSECDVWTGASPKKPIKTIRIFFDGAGGSDVIAQISPDETGFVAVIPPYPWGSEYRKIERPTVEDFRKFGKVFPFPWPNVGSYAKVYDLIAPFRDFQGGALLESDSTELREWAGLDDPKTRLIICRKPHEIRPSLNGPVVAFEDRDRIGGFAYVSLGVDCKDTAIRLAAQRVKAAMEVLMQATDNKDEVDWEAQRPFPYCGRLPGKDALYGPCITPIL